MLKTVFEILFMSMVIVLVRTSEMQYDPVVRRKSWLYQLLTEAPVADFAVVAKDGLSTKT